MRVLSAFTAFLASSLVSAKVDLKSNNGLIKLTDSNFDKLTKGNRDHYAVVLLTALNPQFNCAFCKEFDPEFTLLAKSWQQRKISDGPEVYFGHLDFDNGKETFRSLQLVSAPNFWIYPPTVDAEGKPQSGEPIRFDFGNSITADAAAEFVSRSVGHEFKIVRPFDYVKAGKLAGSIASVVFAIVVVYRVAGFILVNKNFWAVLSIAMILIFNGGYMFTQIRNSPYMRGSYIAGGFQDQFGAEVQIVAATCKIEAYSRLCSANVVDAVLAFSVVTLGISVPRISNPTTQTMLIGVWVVIQFFVFSFLLQLFRQKNGGYPFKLLL